MLTGIDIASVAPLSIAATFGIIVLLLEVFQRPSFSRGYLAYVAAFGCALAGLAAFFLRDVGGHATFGGTSTLDGFGLGLSMLFATGGALAALVSPNYLAAQNVDRGEYYALILFSVCGMMAMASASDFIVFFVGLEIQSVAAYALASFLRPSGKSAEAGMKYFFIGALGSAVLLYGVAMLYGATGTTSFVGIGQALEGGMQGYAANAISAAGQSGILAAAAGTEPTTIAAAGNLIGSITIVHIGVIMVICAFMVKIAAAPFHMWAPDAYTGGPTPAVGFLASAVKLAGVGALIRVVSVAFLDESVRMGPFGWMQVVFWLSLMSMVIGNLVALVQTNVKRMLAYSSVAHAGYLLIAVVSIGYTGNVDHAGGVIFYGFAYTIGTVGAFGVLAYLAKRGIEAEEFEDLNGVGHKYPWLGAAMTVFMLSSAGIPPAAGFMGKLMIFQSAVDASIVGTEAGLPGAHMLMALVVAGVLTSVAGVYYYLRVLVHFYMKKPVRAVGSLPHSGAKFAIALCAALSLWFGILPGKMADLSIEGAEQILDRADDGYVGPADE
ncbi:MAG: NADH-quinone oxidoreductase subunit N [Bradymonadia bacterium]|jgi:NADH-quinone oxidoreductase subunit N